MQELALRVPATAVEDVLDRLLPIAPHGVHEIGRGDEIELRVRGASDELPSRAAVAAAAVDWAGSLAEREVPDDWEERRVLDYEPLIVADRLVVRPPWAPAPPAGLFDLVVDDRDAFGAGTHPTTRACLEALCAMTPRGALADLGCGSGILAIAAALLGWDSVVAIEYDTSAVATARANAARNGVGVEVREGDLTREPAPPADVLVANVPLELHTAIASQFAEPPSTLIMSGVLAVAADEAIGAYEAAGLREAERYEAAGWARVTLTRASSGRR